MTPPAILTELNRLGIAVTTDGDRLRIDTPVGCITDELRTAIFSCKAGLIAILTNPTPDTYADREWRRFFAVAEPTPDGTAWRNPEAMKDPLTCAVVSAGKEDFALEPETYVPHAMRPLTDTGGLGDFRNRRSLARQNLIKADPQQRGDTP